jgi:hypothetical protein
MPAQMLTGQIAFSDKTYLLDNPNGFTSGIAVAIADMNGDGLDDIVRLNNAAQLNIEYQTLNEQVFTHFNYGMVPGEAWAVAVGDVNNDGYCDVMTGGYYDGVKVLTAINNGTGYESATMPGAGIFVQGANFADINNDGHLDVFACHDDGESRIWGNTGTGAFVSADNWIDMATVPVSDNSGNYGSIWTDFDNDGDNDLYIAKCRQGVNDPEDPRRINALFVNDGTNKYSEQAAEFGLKIKWQSWTADFQDIDNDGDMDCLVTNHDYNLQLLENDGTGHFKDISEAAGIARTGGFLQGIMRDFDNDGFMDIITAEPTYVFRNNGDKTFTEISNPFNGQIGTLAAGDLNNDGFIDIYAAYACGINNPCGQPDKMFINEGNDNHYFGVRLKGVQSNRMGVGARIEIHGAWGVQIREVRSGESYGIMNSLTQYYGLGQETEIDYVVVRWPSGMVDVLANPTADQVLEIEEGKTCTAAGFNLEVSGPTDICPGQSVTLTAPAGMTYLWNNGSVSQTLTVDQPGNYKLLALDALGCVAVSNLVHVSYIEVEIPFITWVGDTSLCEGNSVVLQAENGASYIWSNGETANEITVSATGNFTVTSPTVCGDVTSEPVHVSVYPAPPPAAENADVFDAPSAITLTAQGSSPHWYDDPTAIDPLYIGNDFVTPVIGETTTFWVEDLHNYGGGNYETGMPEHQGTLFNGQNFNGQTLFNVSQRMILRQVTVYTDQAGGRVVELRSSSDVVLQSDTFDIPAGITTLDLDFLVEPGNQYKLTTNTAYNLASLGTQSPRLRRSDEAVAYPYETPGVMTITASNFGNGFYYYFYDWQVEAVGTQCVSERIPVVVTFHPNHLNDFAEVGNLSISPNPSSGQFRLEIEAKESGEANFTVSNVTGRALAQGSFFVNEGGSNTQIVDLQGFAPGMYLLQVHMNGHTGRLKLLVD